MKNTTSSVWRYFGPLYRAKHSARQSAADVRYVHYRDKDMVAGLFVNNNYLILKCLIVILLKFRH